MPQGVPGWLVRLRCSHANPEFQPVCDQVFVKAEAVLDLAQAVSDYLRQRSHLMNKRLDRVNGIVRSHAAVTKQRSNRAGQHADIDIKEVQE